MSEVHDQNSDTFKRVNRRNFILGDVEGVAAVSAASYRFLAPSSYHRLSPLDTGERLITLNVNGKSQRVDVMKQETLAWTLRYKLDLNSTRLGCDRAECGARIVLLDDVPHCSCSLLTHTVRGRSVTTAEGLEAAVGKLHPVQQAVIEKQGFQCAFCVSGFLAASGAGAEITKQ